MKILKEQIIHCEERLIAAVKNSDVALLDELIHEELVFILPNGQTGTKADDLAAYRTGNMKVQNIIPGERTITITDDSTAIVTVVVELNATYFGQPVNGKYRYLRVWKRFGNRWQIIAGSCTFLE